MAELTLDVVPPVFVGTQMVSSSIIRALLLDGDFDQANDLLGHRYCVRGMVSEGAARGRTIGFPTANITHIATVQPRDGVYAGVVNHAGRAWPTAINLGPNPTFGDKRRKFEAHLIGFDGDLYGQEIEVELIRRLRDTQPFPNVEALKAQLQQDIRAVTEIVNQN